jgi:hypothetical protein
MTDEMKAKLAPAERWLSSVSLDRNMNAYQKQLRFGWKDTPRWVRVLLCLALVNFLVYVVVAGTHGGDAWNGYTKDGHYFVSQHGHATEVSRSFWMYSYYHTIFLWITHLSAMAAIALYYVYALRDRAV